MKPEITPQGWLRLKDSDFLSLDIVTLNRYRHHSFFCEITEVEPDCLLEKIAWWRTQGATGAFYCPSFALEALTGENTGVYTQFPLSESLPEPLPEPVSVPEHKHLWLTQAVTLYAYTVRSLNHDFKNSLVQQNSAQVLLLWQSLKGRMGLLCHEVPELVATIDQLTNSGSGFDAKAIEACWRKMWQKLQGHRVDTAAFARALQYLSRHWPALLAVREQLSNYPSLSESPRVLSWLKTYSTRRLKQPQRVIRASYELRQVHAELPDSVRQTLHNTLGQHLHAVAACLNKWWAVSETYFPDLRGLNPEQLPVWVSRLPVASVAPSASRYRLLLLEDNPVWTLSIRELLDEMGSFQVFYADHLEAAAELLKTETFDVVVADLSLPLLSGESPQREHGVAFLTTHFGKYQKHPPRLLVHTTPTDFLQDQLVLEKAGVQDTDYIIKQDPDTLRERLEVACTALQRGSSFALDLYPTHGVLNGVVLELSELSWAVLQTLAKAGYLTPTQILKKLAEQGYTQYFKDIEGVESSPLGPKYLQKLLKESGAASMLAALDSNMYNFVLRQLQQLLAAHQAEGFVKVPERFKDNPWLTMPKLYAFLPRLLALAAQTVLPSTHPRQHLHNKVSKMLHALKDEVYQCGLAVQQVLPTHSWIQRDEAGRYFFAQTHLETPQKKVTSPTHDPLRVLLVEDNLLHRQDIENLLQNMATQKQWQIICEPVASLADLPAFLSQNRAPDLVLLDLHLPESPQAVPHQQNGYRLLQNLRDHFGQALPVLVTSTLVHEDTLRTEGLRLGIPLSHFVPKGEVLEELAWPESLRMKILRFLQARKDRGKRALLPSHSALQPYLPALDIFVVSTGKQLVLDVLAPGQCEPTRVVHKSSYAHWLMCLLRQPGLPVAVDTLMPAGVSKTGINNTRTRLRQQIQAQWPLSGQKSELSKVLLYQQTLQQKCYFTLRVHRVIDPQGLLLQG